jgi:hypothetical protein
MWHNKVRNLIKYEQELKEKLARNSQTLIKYEQELKEKLARHRERQQR